MIWEGDTLALQFEHTDRVLPEGRVFEPDPKIAENANITQYQKSKGFATWEELYQWSIEHPEDFWAEQARELHWFKPWDKVKEWNLPTSNGSSAERPTSSTTPSTATWAPRCRTRWPFTGRARRATPAPSPTAQLYADVNKFANALKKLGVKKGDRVVIYLPRVPEQIVAMLAVARIGAVHSVVFSAFTATALRQRVEDAEATTRHLRRRVPVRRQAGGEESPMWTKRSKGRTSSASSSSNRGHRHLDDRGPRRLVPRDHRRCGALLPMRRDGRRRPALHALHLRHHGQAQGRRARARRLHGRRLRHDQVHL